MYYKPQHMTELHHETYRKSHSIVMLVIAAVLLLLLLAVIIYPLLIEPNWLQTEYTSLVCSDLPADVGQLRIVYLSDIHYGGDNARADLNALASKINAQNPDLILLGGDYAHDSQGAIRFFQTLPSLHARYAICAVTGDADRTEPESNFPLLQDAIRQAGVTLLNNTAVPVRIGSGTTIYVAGIDDPLNGTPDLEAVSSSVNSSDFVIFMAHSPSIIDETQLKESADHRRAWFDLGLFGHTHGGQIAPLAALMPTTNDIPSSHFSGWVLENRINMLISNGIGTTGLPLRFLRRPQLHVITITSR